MHNRTYAVEPSEACYFPHSIVGGVRGCGRASGGKAGYKGKGDGQEDGLRCCGLENG